MSEPTSGQFCADHQTRSPDLARDTELAELRSALAAASDQLRLLPGRRGGQASTPLDGASGELSGSYAFPDSVDGGGRAWMQSIVEELLEARNGHAVLMKLRKKLEDDLIARTEWAYQQEQIAIERTQWAQKVDRDLERAGKVIAKLEARNWQLEKQLGVGPAWVNPLGPGDDAQAFFKFSGVIWRLTWPVRFAYRLVRRALARGLWNPLKWPATIRKVSAAVSEHGFRALLGISATVDEHERGRGVETPSAAADAPAPPKTGAKKKRKKTAKKVAKKTGKKKVRARRGQ